MFHVDDVKGEKLTKSPDSEYIAYEGENPDLEMIQQTCP